MTKIAIYGDSFAADYKGWPSYFEKLTKSKVTTFGSIGTSVGYSYLKFLETHEDYDIVYFLWTSINREWLISQHKTTNKLTHYCCFQPNLKDSKTIFKLLKNNFSISKDMEKWIINELENYKLFPDKNLINVIAMRDSVQLKRPDCKNIETFDFYKLNKNKVTSDYIPGMIRIEYLDMMQFSPKHQWLHEIPGKRLNHLTPTQNKEFSTYLYSSFRNNDIDIHETFRNPKKYYSMSKTIEESGFIL